MKKILLVGSTNAVVQSVQDYLKNYYDVQLSEPDTMVVRRMSKIVMPDLILVIKTADVDEVMYRTIRMYIPECPVLSICNAEDECAERYKGGNILFMFKPVNNEEMVRNIEKLTGGDPDQLPGEKPVVDEYGNPLTSDVTKKAILAIDDNGIVLRGLRMILAEEYEVYVSTSVEHGVKLIDDKKFDLIILDYEMPGTDGYTAMQILKTNVRTMDTPIIFLTGVSDKKRIDEVIALKPAAYLLKPIDSKTLKDTIKRVISN